MDEKRIENPAETQPTRLTRREVLRGMVVAAASAVVAACTPQAAAPAAPKAAATTAPAAPAAPTTAPAAPTAAAKAAAPTTAPAAAATTAPTAVAKAAATAPAAAAKAPKTGGKVIWAMNTDQVCLGPFGILNGPAHDGKELMYDSLVAWDKNLQIIPALAESWTTPDDKTYIFKLKQGVKFHSGKELDSEDAKYSIEWQGKSGTLPAPAAAIPQYPKIASVDAVDKYTVKLNMSAPDPTVLGWFAWSRWSSIIPKGFYDSGNPCVTANGSGPFKLVEYVANDRVVMTKFADHWKKGVPYVDEITLKILTDESARVAALRSGAIDGCDISGDTARTLRNDPNITIIKGLTSVPRVLQLTIKGDGKPWNKKEVRQAMSMAINRDDLIAKVFGGEAEWTAALPPGGNPDWTIPAAALKANKYLKFDLAGAKKLMADAGFANGFPMQLIVVTAAEYPQIGEVVKEHLKQIGIEITLVPQENAVFAKSYNEGTFELFLNGRGMRHDAIGYLNEFGIPTAGQAKLWFNDGNGWKNDEIIKLYQSISTTVDQKARSPQIIKLQELEIEEAPHIYLCQPYKFTAVRKRVQDMYVSFTDFRPGLREIWIDG